MITDNVTTERNQLEKTAFDAIMELPEESWERIREKYFLNQGMEATA